MGIKSYNPYTPSRRHMTGSDFSEITAAKPEKSLVTSLKKNAGRNNQGKITVRHQGGGSRRKYRIIDFKRRKDGIPATVKTIEYDPNRTANIALICYADGEKAYILAPEGLKVGQKVYNGPEAEVRVGNCLPLELIPVGTMVHNIELHPGKGGQMVRSAGNGAQLMAKEGKYATLRLPSGEMRMVPIVCRATVGVIGNGEHFVVARCKCDDRNGIEIDEVQGVCKRAVYLGVVVILAGGRILLDAEQVGNGERLAALIRLDHDLAGRKGVIGIIADELRVHVRVDVLDLDLVVQLMQTVCEVCDLTVL